MEKLADIRRAHEVVQVQLWNTLPQINPEVLVVEHAELLAASAQKLVAIFMKSGNLQTGYIRAAQFFTHSFAHLLDCILCISDSENFVRASVPVAD